jgi:uncharacterized lipoprotein YddW (UPF0748 family)
MRIRPLLLALAAGALLSAPVVASGAASSPSPAEADPVSCADSAQRQLRGVWIASVVNIDWPSATGLSPAQQRAELLAWYDEAVANGFNAVFVQVRPTADTFWPSRLEPWSKYLTGIQGEHPGWDPLRFAVREAHARNLEFHAWFNPYRVSMDTDVDALVPDHPARVHPDWRVEYAGKLYYDPGVPAARKHTEAVILEAVRRYDIDAVHFDDYFYPYPDAAGTPFPDDATFHKYGYGYPDTPEGRADWRRHNVDLLVSELRTRIHATKPWVKFGVSPFAVWRNASTDPEGSDTEAGAETYDDLYADTRGWVREEWVDYIAPQVYWNIGFAVADYAKLVPWWAEQVEGTSVQLYIGQATYKIGVEPPQDPAWLDPEEMTRHLAFNRDVVNADGPAVDGDIYFSAKDVRADRLGGMSIVVADHYRAPALIPVSALLPGRAPDAPEALRARRTPDGVALRWRGDGSSYAIYRVEAGACQLVGTVHDRGRHAQRWTDTEAPDAAAARYAVTALDRTYREGEPAVVRVP